MFYYNLRYSENAFDVVIERTFSTYACLVFSINYGSAQERNEMVDIKCSVLKIYFLFECEKLIIKSSVTSLSLYFVELINLQTHWLSFQK